MLINSPDVKAFNPFPLSETKSKTINVPLIKRKDEIQICKDPSYSNRYKHQNIAQASKAQENLKAFEPPLNQIPTLIDSRHDNTLLDPLVTSKNHQICKPCPATQVNEKRVSIKLNGRNGRLMTCSGCPRCNFRVQFPDDLFEGKILQYEDLLPTKVGCEYVICQECIKVYNFPEANTIKEHLKSPEHTRNVLLRLHKAGVKPTETTETKHRVINLDSYAKLHGFASVKDYITKDPLLPPEISKPLPLLTNGPCRIVNPSLNQLPASGGTNTLNEYEVKTPEYRSPDKQSLSSKAPEDEDETIYVNDKIEYHNSSVHNLSQIGNVHQKLNLLYIQQRKTSELLDMVEGDLSKVQDSIKEISCKVQNCSDQTESLTEICLRHDNAIKILQKEAIDGKNFSNIMDGQIDGMMGVTTREALSSRLEKQDKELTSLRLELKNKVEDVNYWLKVIDRHTNDIHLLKQNAWINGQMQNPEESYRTLTQKLEYQIQINEQTTRNCMLQMENRFDAVTRQYADEINFLRQMDEEKKLQILNLKAQLGLKFAHMEQKQSSLRKARKYL